MRLTRRQWFALAALPAAAQQEDFQVYKDPPRLFLTPQRLRRLRRERERSSPRWTHFDALISGGARMLEPGFAQALHFQVTSEVQSARRAVDAAAQLQDLRQLALVYDWCRPHADGLASRLQAALVRPSAARPGIAEVNGRVLAAIALGDAAPKAAEAETRRAVLTWWRGHVIPGLKAGRNLLPRSELLLALETLHALRDNLGIELREGFVPFFEQLPLALLLGYYPAIYPAPENDYRIPAVRGAEPDLAVATLARAADLCLVSYDPNLQEHQFLQGWLMNDRFMMRGALGAPYEFLWANPYQPGLSYHLEPTILHDAILGRLYLRSGWEDGAEWLAWFDGELQAFSDGAPQVIPIAQARAPFRFGDVVALAVTGPGRFRVSEEMKALFLFGLPPDRAWDIELDDREMQEERSDPGGIVRLDFPTGFAGGIRVRPRFS